MAEQELEVPGGGAKWRRRKVAAAIQAVYRNTG
jgi:hypothetical protein